MVLSSTASVTEPAYGAMQRLVLPMRQAVLRQCIVLRNVRYSDSVWWAGRAALLAFRPPAAATA
eukprot:3941505-Rhodomonas_salina.1